MPAKILASFLLAVFPAAALAAWQMIATDQGRRVEIDRASILSAENASLTARGRIVFDKPIVDPKTSLPYSIIEIESRYDCGQRAYATLKRTYYKEDGSLLRQDEVGPPIETLVRSGTPDDRLLREVCRPSNAPASVAKTLDRINEAAGELRQSNAALIERAVKKEKAPTPASIRFSSRSSYPVRTPRPDTARPANSPPRQRRAWGYDGDTGPAYWSELAPDYAACANGLRQSPIDLRESFAVDLAPIDFLYPPAPFRITDMGPYLQMTVQGGGIELSGKDYRLTHAVFHSPSEFLIAGQGFDMEAQLFHRAEDGRQAIVSVLLAADGKGENPVVQAALNNLPLEKGGENVPPGQAIDLTLLLPDERGYFTFMGSLTTPPCAEEVLWLVLKSPRSISSEQLTMFQRLYRPNARPIQPVSGRIIKESR